MAWCFELVAECGKDEEAANGFSEHFHCLQLDLSDGHTVSCSAHAQSDELGNWWGIVLPVEMSYGTPSSDHSLTDRSHTSKAGFLLYDRLKTAPPYRYALVGWEVEGFRLFDELNATEFEEESRYHGIVLVQSLWRELGAPLGFEPFVADYVWKPYRGEIRAL